MPRSGADDYRDSTRLTLTLVAALAVFVVLSETSIWAAFLEMDLLREAMDEGVVLYDAAAADERRRALTGGLHLLSFCVSAGLFLRWVHRMNRNARALAAEGMRHRPFMAAGWFLVPGFHLFEALDVLRELFRASSPQHIEDWKRAPVPHLLTLWWTLWGLFQLTMLLALASDFRATSVADLHAAAWGTVVAGVVAAPLGVAAAIGAWRVHSLQRARYRCTAPQRVQRPWPTRAALEEAGSV